MRRRGACWEQRGERPARRRAAAPGGVGDLRGDPFPSTRDGAPHRHGPAPRAAAAPALLDRPGAALLVMGFGGGLDEHSDVGDVVVADAVQGPDGKGWRARARRRWQRRWSVAGCGCATGRSPRWRAWRWATRACELREAEAIAVDMESVWLAPGAGARPFAVVRVISDTPARELTNPLRTVSGVARAMATLRRAAGALHEWTPEQATEGLR